MGTQKRVWLVWFKVSSTYNFLLVKFMQQELLDWKSKGLSFKYKDFEIFYRKEGSGPVLLIVHGYPYNTFDWKDVWADLKEKYTLIAPDMLGMGFSDKPQKYDYSFEDMANLYTELLKYLKIEKCHIISHDLGNSVVQELIARDLEKKNSFQIESVAFLNGGLFTDAYQPRLIQILLSKSPKLVGKLISRLMPRAAVEKATAVVFGRFTKPDQELQQNFWDILNYKDGKAIAYLLGRLVFSKERFQKRWITAMQKTGIPLCFINGPADPNSGIKMVNRYIELIPHPKIILLNENIGHWLQLEDPSGVLDAYKQFRKQPR